MLPVDRIKEKLVLVVHRAGIKRVILPRKNRKDLPDIPEEITKDIRNDQLALEWRRSWISRSVTTRSPYLGAGG